MYIVTTFKDSSLTFTRISIVIQLIASAVEIDKRKLHKPRKKHLTSIKFRHSFILKARGL